MTPQKKQIRLLIFAKSLDGGTGTFVLDLQDLIKLSGMNKMTISTLVLEKPSYRKVEGGKINYWADANYYPDIYTFSFKNIYKFIKEVHWLNEQITSFNPSVILAVDSHCMLLAEAVKLLRPGKFKTLVSMHNNLKEVIYVKATPNLHFILFKIIRFFLNRADAVVCVSESLAKNFKKSFKLEKTPKAIQLGHSITSKKVAKNYPANKKRIIISIARFAEQKDHKTLLEAFKINLSKIPKIELWLIGDGPLKKKVEKYAADLKIKKRVKFIGWAQNPSRFIRKSHIFALSSKREGFPYVLLEAMSLGMPVVSTNSPFGPKEILGNGKYGFLTPVGDVNSMAKAIKKLLLDKSVYNFFARRSINRSKQFTKKKMLLKYKKLILKISK